MCNQRERLIAYIYDECDTTERDLVQQHLDSCAECQVEIAGLRSVREDLLAWDVPAHESVWRPFAPAPAKQWWRQVPAWAMAAAAAVVMVSGAAGGAVLHAFLPESVSAQRNDVVPPAAVSTPDARPVLTMADMSASEERIVMMLREQLRSVDARIQKASTSSQSLRGVEGSHDALVAEVVKLRDEKKDLLEVITSFNNDFERFRFEQKTKYMNLLTQVGELRTIVQNQITDGKK